MNVIWLLLRASVFNIASAVFTGLVRNGFVYQIFLLV
jgi:hypothetical protein